MAGVSAAASIAGRYSLHQEFAAGGMAAVHFGRQLGAAGFARTVAIKRLHAHLARDPDFVAMFIDEATLAARIRHPNVVPTLDVVQHEGELLLVMEYVAGESLAGLCKAARRMGERLPAAIALRIVCDVLQGLHAAHEATTDGGVPLEIVHRDVSPSNVVVGTDGVARVLDFGVAKATVRVSSTRDGGLKGKLRYMAPEQIADREVSRRTDVYAASVLLWELLTGEVLFNAGNEAALIARILEGVVPPPSRRDPSLPAALDQAVLRGLAKDPADRFATARDAAEALEEALAPATARQVGDWVERVAREPLARRAALLARVEAGIAGEPAAAAPEAPHTATAPPAPAPPASAATEVMDGPTQLAAGHTLAPSGSRTGRLGLVVMAAIAVSAGGVLASRLPGDSEPAGQTVVGAPTPSPSEPPVAVRSEPAPTVTAAEVASAPSSEPTREAPPIATRTRPARNTPPPAAPKARSCNPPYVVDANGRRRVKRECL